MEESYKIKIIQWIRLLNKLDTEFCLNNIPKEKTIVKANKLPKVSIITPSYNQGEYLEETIKSILMQTYPNIEYIIIDGKSTDNTKHIIKKYDKFISYSISEPDNGQSDAINKGFRIATGDYLCWINSDDLLHPYAIEKLVNGFVNNPEIDFIYGDVIQGETIDINNEIIYGDNINLKEMFTTLRIPIPQQGSMWKKNIMENVGELNVAYNVVLDRDFFTRIVIKCNILYLQDILGFFRIHKHSKSLSMRKDWIIELPKMYENLFKENYLNHEVNSQVGECLGVVYLTCASLSLKCKLYIKIPYFLFKALESDKLIFFKKFIIIKIKKLLVKNLKRLFNR